LSCTARRRSFRHARPEVRGFTSRTQHAPRILELFAYFATVFEIALRHRGDAFCVLYALQIGAALWVIHPFKKKSKPESSRRRWRLTLFANGSND
jgi:hypothetical protein